MTAAPRPPVTMNEICNETCPLGVCRPNEPICPASPEIKLAIHRENRQSMAEQEQVRAEVVMSQKRANLAMARNIRTGLARLGFRKYDGRCRRGVYRQAREAMERISDGKAWPEAF